MHGTVQISIHVTLLGDPQCDAWNLWAALHKEKSLDIYHNHTKEIQYEWHPLHDTQMGYPCLTVWYEQVSLWWDNNKDLLIVFFLKDGANLCDKTTKDNFWPLKFLM